MPLLNKLVTLWRWRMNLRNSRSLLAAVRLYRMTGRDAGPAVEPVSLKPTASPLTTWCRPGTSDFPTFMEIFFNNEYAAADRLIPKNVTTVLDLGSNVGISVAFFHGLWPAAHFVGVEPDEANIGIARRTLEPLLRDGRVRLNRCFVGARPRAAALQPAGTGGANEFVLAELSQATDHNAIPVRTVPDLLAEAAIDVVDLLKCDIEGGERETFSDCGAWINRVRFLVLELHRGLDARWLIEVTTPQGARLVLLEEERKGTDLWLVWFRNDAAITRP